MVVYIMGFFLNLSYFFLPLSIYLLSKVKRKKVLGNDREISSGPSLRSMSLFTLGHDSVTGHANKGISLSPDKGIIFSPTGLGRHRRAQPMLYLRGTMVYNVHT